MVDFVPVHPLGDIEAINEEFANTSSLSISVNDDFSCVQLFAKKGSEDAVCKKLKIEMQPGVASQASTFTALPLSPGQWMLISKKRDSGFCESVSKKVKGLGYVSQQGDSRICLTVSGRSARDLLSRGCRLDLHPSVTAKGFCAQTNMAQTGVLIHQTSDEPAYDLYLYAGFARSFWHWLRDTGRQFS